MSAFQHVRCSNCGNFAERRLLSDRQAPINDDVIHTSCPVCDYLMVMGVSTGKVIEAYAPGQPGHLCSIDCVSNADSQPHCDTPYATIKIRDLSHSRILTV